MSDIRFNPDEMRARGYEARSISAAVRAVEARARALELIARVQTTFGDIPRPAITLSVARGYDDEWTLSEERGQELTAQDPERNWSEVSDEAIQGHQEYFTFSDAEGFRFYLPAFMCHYLRTFPYSNYDAVYYACTDAEKLAALTQEECRLVETFLDLCHKYQGHGVEPMD